MVSALSGLALLLAASAAYTAENLPDIGDPVGKFISPAQERELGQALLREVRHHLPVADDAFVTQYIDALGKRVTNGLDNANYEYNLFVIIDDAINAFAAPGGYIGINTGLILRAQTESELASVLAHEVAHVELRHVSRAYAISQQLSIPRAAALIASIIVASQNAQAGGAMLMSSQAAEAQYFLNFTRDNEQEADRIGLTILNRAGFDPQGFAAFFRTLEQYTRLSDRPPEFLSTHPSTDNRISDIESRIGKSKAWTGQDNIKFGFIKARLAVLLSSDKKATAKYFEGQYKNNNNAGFTYGHALSQLEIGNWNTAKKLFEELQKSIGELDIVLIGLADTHAQAGDYDAAEKLYRKAVSLYPKSAPVLSHYARAALQANQYAIAYDLLKRPVRESALHPILMRQYAESALATGHIAESYQYLAEYHFNIGQENLAIEHLEKALSAAKNDTVLTAQLSDRLGQMKKSALAKREPQ